MSYQVGTHLPLGPESACEVKCLAQGHSTTEQAQCSHTASLSYNSVLSPVPSTYSFKLCLHLSIVHVCIRNVHPYTKSHQGKYKLGCLRLSTSVCVSVPTKHSWCTDHSMQGGHFQTSLLHTAVLCVKSQWMDTHPETGYKLPVYTHSLQTHRNSHHIRKQMMNKWTHSFTLCLHVHVRSGVV